MDKILVVGSLNMDIVTRVTKTPKVGETVLGEGLKLIPGGKGANQAVAIGRLGGDVTMVGFVGDDSNGNTLIENLKDNNVVSKVRIADAPTGTAFIMVNESGDNSIVVVPGANFKMEVSAVESELVRKSDVVVCQLENPLDSIESILRKAKKLGKKTVLNPAPGARLTNMFLSNVDLLIPNETEFEILTGIKIESKKDFIKGYVRLNLLGISEVIVTLGSRGSYYYNGVDFIDTPGEKVKTVDTTAAGDSFIGALIYKLSINTPIGDAIKFATKAASVTVTKFGAQSSLPFTKDIK